MPNSSPTGAYYLNGNDLFAVFGVGVEEGGADFLKFPDRKDSTSHNWADENGTDTDLTRVFVESREVTMKMWLLADSEEDFWSKYNGFQQFLTKPGLLRLTVTDHGNRDYFIYYKKMNVLTKVTPITSINKIGIKFTVTFIEQDPTTNQEETFLVTEQTSFIIT